MNDTGETCWTPPDEVWDACRTLGFEVAPAAWHQIGVFLRLLLEANQTINLSAVHDPAEAWNRHILDSLSLLPHLGDARRMVDVGAGGGLPGVVIAIARPDLQVALLEATRKKCRFLENAAANLTLRNVRVVPLRAEDAGRDPGHREQYDLAVARGVASLAVLIEYMAPLVRVGGRILAMKGATVEDELSAAGSALDALGSEALATHDALPGVVDLARIVEIVKRSPTPEVYPRRPGVPSKRPLK